MNKRGIPFSRRISLHRQHRFDEKSRVTGKQLKLGDRNVGNFRFELPNNTFLRLRAAFLLLFARRIIAWESGKRIPNTFSRWSVTADVTVRPWAPGDIPVAMLGIFSDYGDAWRWWCSRDTSNHFEYTTKVSNRWEYRSRPEILENLQFGSLESSSDCKILRASKDLDRISTSWKSSYWSWRCVVYWIYYVTKKLSPLTNAISCDR